MMNKEDILRTFPPALARDKAFAALGEALAEQLEKNRILSGNTLIYPAIGGLSEEVLDTLAYDLNVAWYDYEGTISEKRKTIMECMQVHRYKGTKYAVETALRSVYDTAAVKEWFEYGGEPYHFRVVIYDSGSDEKKRGRILAKVQYYKNIRSVLDETVFIITTAKVRLYAGFFPIRAYKRIRCEVNNND